MNISPVKRKVNEGPENMLWRAQVCHCTPACQQIQKGKWVKIWSKNISNMVVGAVHANTEFGFCVDEIWTTGCAMVDMVYTMCRKLQPLKCDTYFNTYFLVF